MNVPATRSILSAGVLAAELPDRYELGPPITCRLISGGVNDTYLVTAAGRRYVLRVYRAGWRSRADIGFELDALQHLACMEMAAAQPVAMIDGSFVLDIVAPEGLRHAVLFSYVPGRVVDDLDAPSCRRFGDVAGRIHAATEHLRSPHSRFALDLEHLLDRPLAAVMPLLHERSDDRRYLQELVPLLRARVVRLAADGLDWGFCHGDLHAENAHLDGEWLTFFDFDCGGLGWRSYDIAVFRWTLNDYGRRVVPEHEAAWQAFLAGYTEHRHLGPADVEAVPLFVAIRHIWMMGLHAEFAPDYGYGRFENGYFERVLQFLRDWEAAYL